MPLRRAKKSTDVTALAEHCVRPNESVVFFPTAATLDQAGECWEIPIHGWIYRPAELSRLRRSSLSALKVLLRRRIGKDGDALSLFEKRARSFLADNNGRRRLQICAGTQIFTMRPSRADGHFSGAFRLSTRDAASAASQENDGAPSLPFFARQAGGDVRLFRGRAALLSPTGLSIISDIDDTIKITDVLSKRKMLRRTFLQEFASVPEMAALYQRWQKNHAASFHYVSASPWHLYPFLSEFLAGQGFPEGTFHLRDFRLMPPDLHRTLKPSRRVKIKHARALLKQFPQRTFWLVGDSGESDAKIYAKLAREFPKQIQKIFIRDASDAAKAVACEKILSQLPGITCTVFKHPHNIA